jgi:ribosomal protein S18 acetylase RimI-like enzyme
MPVDPSSDCRLLTLSDVEQAAQVISQAFADDPLCSFMLPRRKTRVKTLYKFFKPYGEVFVKNNLGYGVGDPLQGVAYWIFPHQESLSISFKSIGKFIPLLLTFYPIGYVRAKAVLRQIDFLHKKYAAEPHFYLDNLGVLPSARGRGWSSKLIRPFLEMADAQKVIAYTDTVTRSNVALYEHFGFQCVEESTVAGTGLTVFALRRPTPQDGSLGVDRHR